LDDLEQFWVLFTWQQRFEFLALGFESSRSPAKLAKRFESSNLDSRIRLTTTLLSAAVGLLMVYSREICSLWSTPPTLFVLLNPSSSPKCTEGRRQGTASGNWTQETNNEELVTRISRGGRGKKGSLKAVSPRLVSIVCNSWSAPSLLGPHNGLAQGEGNHGAAL
jgi:hypothetical protein